MRKILPLFFTFLFLTSCASPPPVVSFTPPNPTPIILNVAAVNVVDHSGFQPSDSPYHSYNLTPTITDALKTWLAQSIRAGGSHGQALVLIKDASLDNKALPIQDDDWMTRPQASKYTGHVEVSVEVQGIGNYGAANAEATQAVTLPKNPTTAERNSQYNILLNGLLNNLTQQIKTSVQTHLGNFTLVNANQD
jgi:hypothetical protein